MDPFLGKPNFDAKLSTSLISKFESIVSPSINRPLLGRVPVMGIYSTILAMSSNVIWVIDYTSSALFSAISIFTDIVLPLNVT
jgi:hypothetical protein